MIRATVFTTGRCLAIALPAAKITSWWQNEEIFKTTQSKSSDARALGAVTRIQPLSPSPTPSQHPTTRENESSHFHGWNEKLLLERFAYFLPDSIRTQSVSFQLTLCPWICVANCEFSLKQNVNCFLILFFLLSPRSRNIGPLMEILLTRW